MSKSVSLCFNLLVPVLLFSSLACQTAKALRPVCSTPLFDGKGNLTMVCSTDDANNQVSCHFFVHTNNDAGTTKLEPTVNTAGPYNTCKMTIPEYSLQPGRHRFKVMMYPIIDGIEFAPGMVESSLTSAILIPSSLCLPAEENKPYTLKLTLPSLPGGNTVVWEDQVDPKCTCTAGITDCVCKDGFQATLFPDGVGGYVSTFIIARVSRSQAGTTWTCKSTEALYSCPFQVFVLPTDPVCTTPVLQNNGSVSITCMCENIFPQAACHFFRKTQGSSIEERPPTVNVVEPSNSCSLTTVITEGSHEFQVKMAPVIAGQEYSKAGLTQSAFTSPVVVEFPKVILADDCPPSGSFVPIETNVNCTCLRNDSSDLFTLLAWNDSDTPYASNSTSALLSFTTTNKNTVFTCTATNSIGRSSRVNLNLNTVYGPENALVKTTGYSTIHLCDSSVQVQVQCQVSTEDVNPAPTFAFTFNQSHTTTPVLGQQENSIYTLTEIRTIAVGGPFSVACMAINSVLTHLSAQDNIILSIIEPPSPPVIKILQNGASVDVSDIVLEEDKATITCQAYGGYPSVRDIRLSVGSLTKTLQEVSNISDYVSMTINITREMINYQFACLVNHPSVCNVKNIKTSPIRFSSAKTESGDESRTTSNETAIVLGTVIGVLVLLLIIFIVCCIRRKRGTQEGSAPCCLFQPHPDPSDPAPSAPTPGGSPVPVSSPPPPPYASGSSEGYSSGSEVSWNTEFDTTDSQGYEMTSPPEASHPYRASQTQSAYSQVLKQMKSSKYANINPSLPDRDSNI